jgi:hypothetical protein
MSKNNLFVPTWGKSAAVLGVTVFGVLAAIPYLQGGAKLLAAGETVDLSKVQKVVEKENKEKDKAMHEKKGNLDVKAVAALPDGTVYFGGKIGLYRAKGGKAEELAQFPGEDVKSIAATTSGEVLVAAKQGVWASKDGAEWKQVAKGDAHGVSIAADGSVYVAMKDDGVVRRAAGSEEWTPVKLGLDEQAMASKAKEIEQKEKEKKEKEKKAKAEDPGYKG